MTFNKPKPIMLMLLSGMMVLFLAFGYDTNKSFIDELKVKLKQFNQSHRFERTFLMTDRFVYRPGEDVWFKGYVMSSLKFQSDALSQDLFIKLMNAKGEEIIFRRYPVKNKQVAGRFLVPRTLIPGKYWLVSYTGLMKNQNPKEAFRKEILISRYFEKRFMVEPIYDKVFYFPGDTMVAVIKITDALGKPIDDMNYEYSIESFNDSKITEAARTDAQGISRIVSRIPESDDILMLTVKIRTRKLSGDYSVVIPSYFSKPDVTFFPEGGKLIKGLKSRVAYKINDKYGQPLVISGKIIDQSGNLVREVESSINGKGVFDYVPSDDSCYFIINHPVFKEIKYPLPQAENKGAAIHMESFNDDTLRFSIHSSDAQSEFHSYWIATMEREIVWDKLVNFTSSASIGIPLSDMPAGILQISVFNDDHEKIAERLFNIKNKVGQLSAKTDRQIYQSRQRVNLVIEYAGNSSFADAALTVSLKSLSNHKGMKGIKETFSAPLFDTSRSSLSMPSNLADIDMLTTDYRNINWSMVMADSTLVAPLQGFNGLTGKVLDKKESISRHAKVRITHIPNFRTYETQTDENGLFHVIFGADIIDFNFLNIDAYDALGKVNLTAVIDQKYAEKLVDDLISKRENENRQKLSDVFSFGEPNLVYSLRYGPGKFHASETDVRKKYDPNKYADYTDVLDIIQDIKPFQIENSNIVFVEDELNPEPARYQNEAIIVINGVLKGNNINIFKDILPSDITNINISTSLFDVHKYTTVNFPAVIEITTIQGMYRYRAPVFQLGSDITNTNRTFYSPDYSLESNSSSDNRKTLYWNPQLTLKSKQPELVTFFTSDISGVYYGTIEGMDSEGNPIQADFSFVVE
jgi:hypothetical protein